jgi:hypothetical protein
MVYVKVALGASMQGVNLSAVFLGFAYQAA